MPLVDSRPLTPGQRFLTRNKQEVSKKKPERRLVTRIHATQGRNCYGRITSRRRGGGHKRIYRMIDFRREKLDIPAKVQAIESMIRIVQLISLSLPTQMVKSATFSHHAVS